MKFECPSCGKKYSLPDEKVPAGKDFKVKCKKCSEIIVLHGPSPDAAPAEEPPPQQPPADEGLAGAGGPPPADEGLGPDEQPTRVFDYSRMGGEEGQEEPGPDDFASAQAGAFQAPAAEEPAAQAAAPQEPAAAADGFEWHIAVEGEQMGPYESTQIREMMAAGQIGDETYIWRDGFDDWLPLRDVPDFGAGQEAAPQPAAPAAAPQPAAPAADSPFAIGGGGGQGQDIFAAAGSDAPAESPFASPGPAGVSSSLDAAPQSPRVDAGQLKGARHENSVLFSLSSLQALASSSRDPSPGGLGAPGAAGSASSEGGSGLIDIKALTSGASAAQSGEGKPSDDILSMGGQGLGSSMGVPSLLQPVKKEPSKLPYILGGVGGLVVVAAVVVVLVVVLGGKKEGDAIDEEALRQQIMAELMEQGFSKEKAKALATEQAADQVAQAGTEQGGASAEGEGGSEEEAGGAAEESGGSAKKVRRPGKKRHGGGKSGSGGGGGEEASASSGTSSGGSSGSKSSGSKKSGSIEDDLLAALGGKKPKSGSSGSKSSGSKKSSPSPAPSPSLPDKPTKSQVISALKKVTPGVKSCGKGTAGVATVSINIAGATGRVTSASVVSGPFKGKPQAGCIVKAVKKARFPKFSQKKFSVSYPFVIK
jgi:predicted Zn finger-like uncharacterized protein